MVVAFLSAPEKLTFGRCKSDECPFITFHPSGNFFTWCVVLTCFLCTDWWAVTYAWVCALAVCSHPLHTFMTVQYVCLCVLCMLESVCVYVCMCLVRLGLFGQLFGGKAWSHVTLCFSSCSWIRTTSPLCQETRRTGPKPSYYCW